MLTFLIYVSIFVIDVDECRNIKTPKLGRLNNNGLQLSR